MVEINNQRKAFLDMLAWSEGTDNGRQKPEIMSRHCRRRAIYWLLRSLSQTCHAKPKIKSTGAGRYQLLSRYGMPIASSLLKDFSPKMDAVALQQTWSVALYLWLIVVISVRQSTVAAISGQWSALVMSRSSIRLTAWLQIQEAGGTVREIERMSRVTMGLSPALRGYLHHRLPVSGLQSLPW